MRDERDFLTLCGKRAEAGDGRFAIAYALLRLVGETSAMRRDLCFGTGVGEHASPGALELVSIRLRDLADATRSIADNIEAAHERD